MGSLKDAALDYAKKGWPIFPCRSDKSPYTASGVLDATTNLTQIEKWWEQNPLANIGLDVGSANMMVLYLDPGHSMDELEKNVGKIPETKLHSNTPRGGKHLFFDLKAGEIVSPSGSKLAPFVDVRSFHSYVLLPPSKTEHGVYGWVEQGLPAYRTDEFIRSSNSGREKSKDRDEWIIKPDLQENIASAIKWLKEKAQIAIDGQGGDHMAFATAAHMKSFGISQELAFDIIWEHWNPRCAPPWSSDNAEHLQKKVENGYAYNTSPPGNITPAYHTAKTLDLFKPIETKSGDTGHEWNAGRFRVVDYDGMQGIQPPEWLVESFLPAEAYAILFGAPGTFKTFLALDLALSIAAGFGMSDKAMWPNITKAGPVLFAAGEGRASITKRVKAWSKVHFYGNPIPGFHLVDPVPMVAEELEPFLEVAKAAVPGGYRLVVLDTVGRSMQGLNENAQEHASAFTNMVGRIQHELGCAVLALHHTGHGEGSRARGSSVFGADADTIIKLERHGKSYTVSLSMEKQKDAQEWEEKKYVQLNEVMLGIDTETLVAVKGLKPIKSESKEEDKTILLDIVEAAVIEHLKGNKLVAYSNAALAEAVASMVKLDEQTLRKNYFPILRETGGRPVARCYDKDAKPRDKWRWQD
jgi:hypothetical protein